jgi:two-component system nitrogen regulation response regulator GlnG
MAEKQHTIMVVDDDAAVRTVLTRALTQAGYEVKTAANAAGMWALVEKGVGDVLISDVVLPDAEAFDILPRIRLRRPHLPVIVMSARNTVMTAIKAAERGAFEYLPKPFELSEMLGAVRRALERRQDEAARADDDGQERLPLIWRSRAMQEVSHHRAAHADRSAGADPGRVRHRQGAGGAGAA